MHVICKDGKYLLERGIVIRWCQETDMSSLMRLCINAFYVKSYMVMNCKQSFAGMGDNDEERYM